MTETEFLEAIERGPFAWPGGYPLFFIMDDGEALSFKDAEENQDEILEAINNSDKNGWFPEAVEVNWEDNDLYSAHSNDKIECAYCEDE